MQSFPASHGPTPLSDRIHPALTSFADEVCATLARLFAYVGALALFGILAVHAWDQLQIDLRATSPRRSRAGASPTAPTRPSPSARARINHEKSDLT